MLPTSASRAMTSKALVEHDLCAQVWAEFREMPGLTLTPAQAARLFHLDPARCARVLDALVTSGVLTTNGIAFARADMGQRYA